MFKKISILTLALVTSQAIIASVSANQDNINQLSQTAASLQVMLSDRPVLPEPCRISCINEADIKKVRSVMFTSNAIITNKMLPCMLPCQQQLLQQVSASQLQQGINYLKSKILSALQQNQSPDQKQLLNLYQLLWLQGQLTMQSLTQLIQRK